MVGIFMENEIRTETAQLETVVPETKPMREAMMIASAILLGSLIVAGAIIASTPKTVTPVAATQQTGADKPAQKEKVSVTMDLVKSLFTDKNIFFGNKESKVLFVEFSDPSCPYCHVAAGKNPGLNKQMGGKFIMVGEGGSYVPPVPEMKKLVDAGKAAFVWLYANGHGNGEMGTQALYCAKEKGRFWEVHDLLMSGAGYAMMNTTVKNDTAKAGVLADFLKNAVTPADMKSCLESGKYNSRLTEDMAIAQQFGFGGTPNFFVNTENFTGAYNWNDIKPTVEKLLK